MSDEQRAAIRRRPFCPGCGLHYAVHNEHRRDCTATPETRIRLHLRANRTKG